MQLAVLWLWYLSLCSYSVFYCFCLLRFYIFPKSGIDHVLALRALLTRAIFKRLTIRKFLFDCVYVFYFKFVWGLILLI